MSGVLERAPGIEAGRASIGRRRVTMKQALLGVAGAIGLAAAAAYGTHYWQVGRFEVETDDAYVRADSIIIAPRVAGYIAEVPVNDNQPVKAGQVLARIDDRDLRTALALDPSNADAQAGLMMCLWGGWVGCGGIAFMEVVVVLLMLVVGCVVLGELDVTMLFVARFVGLP